MTGTNPERRKIIKKRGSSRGIPPILKYVAVCLGLVTLVWLGWGSVWGFVLQQFVDYYEVDMGIVEKEMSVDKALVVRDETVLFAPQSGIIKLLVVEGQRVAEGEIIAQIQSVYGGSQPITAVKSGKVFYHTDGLENVLRPQAVETLKIADLEASSYQLQETVNGASVELGQPVIKIVDNLQPTLVWLQFDVDYLDSFPAPGKQVKFRLEGSEYQGRVAKVVPKGIMVEALLELSREELLLDRELSLNLVLASKKGLMVPNQALVVKDREPGVYKKTPKGCYWVPVVVVMENEDYSIVEGLRRGDLVALNPSLILENDSK